MDHDTNNELHMSENLNNTNPEIPAELRSLEAELSQLGHDERCSAPEGFEARLLDAVGAALAPAPIAIERGKTRHASHRASWIGLAAAVVLVASVGLLTVNSAGLFSNRAGTQANTAGGGAISQVAFSDDVDLLLELVDSDLTSNDPGDGLSYSAQVDSVSLDVMTLDSRLQQPAWDSLDSLVDSYAEGAI